ncbi:hypothetical protein [Providencia rettgeri]
MPKKSAVCRFLALPVSGYGLVFLMRDFFGVAMITLVSLCNV